MRAMVSQMLLSKLGQSTTSHSKFHLIFTWLKSFFLILPMHLVSCVLTSCVNQVCCMYVHVRFRSVVLFLVHSMETNIYDQRLLEYSIRETNVSCRVIRRTLQDIQERGKLGDRKQLLM